MKDIAQEHLEDLQKSGLTENTIREAKIYTVPPKDINKILGWDMPIKSLLAFPYPGCNGFTRYKLFPDFKQNDGIPGNVVRAVVHLHIQTVKLNIVSIRVSILSR